MDTGTRTIGSNVGQDRTSPVRSPGDSRQIVIPFSPDPARHFPSGLNATQEISPMFSALGAPSSAHDRVSQTRIRPPQSPVASIRPSGLKAAASMLRL